MSETIMTIDDYKELVKRLNEYSHLYYNRNVSPVSDTEFDELMRQLEDTEKQHPEWKSDDSPTVKVGADPSSSFVKRTHVYPMLSLAKAFNYAELDKFHNRCVKAAKACNRELSYYVDCKMDGLSCDLHYRDGKLVCALTRGNGRIGEDVTENVYRIPNVPRRITYKGDVYVFGEVVVNKSDFRAINRMREQQGLTVFSNPRNYASGSLRQSDPAVTDERKLRFIAWRYIDSSRNMTCEEQCEELTKYGFNMPKHRVCSSVKDIIEYITEIANERSTLTYEIDGMVIKVNDFAIRKKLGHNSHDPLWAIAWKFEASGTETEISDILWTVGRTGKLTPIAKLKPVFINGVRVENVSVANAATLEKLKAGIGSRVRVVRRGDVIPKISDVLSPCNSGTAIPTVCPYCGETLVRRSSDLYCVNDACPGVFSMWLKYLVSKDCLDIKGIGDTFITEAIQSGTVTKFEDLFTSIDNKSCKLKDDDLVSLVNRFRSVNLFEALMCLNIPGMGRALASKLAMTVRSLPGLVACLSDAKKLEFLTITSSAKHDLAEWYSVPSHAQRLDYLVGLNLPKLNNAR